MTLFQPIRLTAYPNSNNTFGLGVFLNVLDLFIIEISAIKMSHLSIFLRILSAISGLPNNPSVFQSISNTKDKLFSLLIFFSVDLITFSIRFRLYEFGKSDCQEKNIVFNKVHPNHIVLHFWFCNPRHRIN